jgi:hypothetical protein
MNELNCKILAALPADEAAALGPLDELSVWRQFTETLKGRLGWLVLGTSILQPAFVIFAVVCAIYFFRADSVREMLAWAGGFGFGLVAAIAARLWIWMLMHHYGLLREIKRVELQLARLAARIKATAG